MTFAIDLSPGAVHVVERYPFTRTTFRDFGSGIEELSWKPGVYYEVVGPEGEADAVCDAFGKQIYTVISTHKPGKFPERVFFTRQWEDPDGMRFGKTNLRIAVRHVFIKRVRGYGFGASHIQQPRLRSKKEAA